MLNERVQRSLVANSRSICWLGEMAWAWNTGYHSILLGRRSVGNLHYLCRTNEPDLVGSNDCVLSDNVGFQCYRLRISRGSQHSRRQSYWRLENNWSVKNKQNTCDIWRLYPVVDGRALYNLKSANRIVFRLEWPRAEGSAYWFGAHSAGAYGLLPGHGSWLTGRTGDDENDHTAVFGASVLLCTAVCPLLWHESREGSNSILHGTGLLSSSIGHRSDDHIVQTRLAWCQRETQKAAFFWLRVKVSGWWFSEVGPSLIYICFKMKTLS